MTQEKRLEQKEYNKFEIVKEAIKEHPVYKRMLRNIEGFPMVSINLDAMVEMYMDDSTNENTLKNQDYYAIDDTVIQKVLLNTIRQISKEENGLVLHSNGSINLEKTLEQQMYSTYDVVRGTENLTPEQKLGLKQTFEDMNQRMEKFMSNGNKADLGQALYFFHSLSKEEQEAVVVENAEKTTSESRAKSFLATEKQVKAMNVKMEIYECIKEGIDIPPELQKSAKKYSKEMGACLDPETGELNFDEITSEVENYKARCAEKESAKTIQHAVQTEKSYASFQKDEQRSILQSCFILLNSEDKENVVLAVQTLERISGHLIKYSEAGEPSLDEDVFRRLYNDTSEGKTNYTMKTISNQIAQEHSAISKRQIDHLLMKIENGTFIECRESQAMTSEDIQKLTEEINRRTQERNNRKINPQTIDYMRAKDVIESNLGQNLLQFNSQKDLVYIAYKRATMHDDKEMSTLLKQYILFNKDIFEKYIQEDGQIHKKFDGNTLPRLWNDDAVGKTLAELRPIAQRMRIKERKGFSMEKIVDGAMGVANKVKSWNPFAKKAPGLPAGSSEPVEISQASEKISQTPDREQPNRPKSADNKWKCEELTLEEQANRIKAFAKASELVKASDRSGVNCAEIPIVDGAPRDDGSR